MKSLKIKKRSTKSEGVREDHTWIQVEKPNSNTQECYPIRWKGPLQQEGNISYHSICPRKSSVERKKKISTDLATSIHTTKSFIF